MTLYEYLRQLAEPIPSWLADFQHGDVFNRQSFFASRIVYYAGAGFDGHPVKLFGSTHSAHCFVYVDYGVTEAEMIAEIEHPRWRFLGYHTLARLQLAEHDLAPRGWTPHVSPGETGQQPYRFVGDGFRPFGFLEVLQRDEQRDDPHGPERLAVLFLGADGIAAYDALFCQKPHVSNPFAVVLQDHRGGGGYDSFGRGGLLECIATRCDVFPKLLLVADNTSSWQRFCAVPGVDGDPGGTPRHIRYLFGRCDELNLEDDDA